MSQSYMLRMKRKMKNILTVAKLELVNTVNDSQVKTWMRFLNFLTRNRYARRKYAETSVTTFGVSRAVLVLIAYASREESGETAQTCPF